MSTGSSERAEVQVDLCLLTDLIGYDGAGSDILAKEKFDSQWSAGEHTPPVQTRENRPYVGFRQGRCFVASYPVVYRQHCTASPSVYNGVDWTRRHGPLGRTQAHELNV